MAPSSWTSAAVHNLTYGHVATIPIIQGCMMQFPIVSSNLEIYGKLGIYYNGRYFCVINDVCVKSSTLVAIVGCKRDKFIEST